MTRHRHSTPASGAGVPVLLGLGSNLQQPRAQLLEAVRRLRGLVEEVRCSSVFRTQPVGYADQPDFENVVARGMTRLAPHDLLRGCLQIELDLGRTRTFPNAPRTIDIDLLAYGDRVLESPELTVPHPRLHLRGFVLVPLAEVAPEWRHPVLGVSAAELLRQAGPLEDVQRLGPLVTGGAGEA